MRCVALGASLSGSRRRFGFALALCRSRRSRSRARRVLLLVGPWPGRVAATRSWAPRQGSAARRRAPRSWRWRSAARR
eukprot:8044361-Alexandrium_andersonii.AAC.1